MLTVEELHSYIAHLALLGPPYFARHKLNYLLWPTEPSKVKEAHPNPEERQSPGGWICALPVCRSPGGGVWCWSMHDNLPRLFLGKGERSPIEFGSRWWELGACNVNIATEQLAKEVHITPRPMAEAHTFLYVVENTLQPIRGSSIDLFVFYFLKVPKTYPTYPAPVQVRALHV